MCCSLWYTLVYRYVRCLNTTRWVESRNEAVNGEIEMRKYGHEAEQKWDGMCVVRVRAWMDGMRGDVVMAMKRSVCMYR